MLIKLSNHIISNELHCPDGKSRVELCDTELPGLYVEVRATSPGQGTYYLRYKNANAKTCHEKLGRTTEIDLAEARRRARQLKAEITAVGRDPRAEAKAQKEIPTFSDFFQRHYMPYVKQRKRSWKCDLQLYELRIKDAFGGRQLTKITRSEIKNFHSRLLDIGLAGGTADHHVKLLRHAFNLAIDWEMYSGPNPAARVALFNVNNKREHFLADDQLQRLLATLHNDRNRPACLIALFLLSTGARRNEALSATWDQVDRENRLWVIPASNSKSKRVRSIPLNDSALEVLDQLDTKGEFDHLFVNKETGKPYTTINKAWERLRKDAGLPHLRLHDLRHTYASLLVNSGRTLYEVQKILGHSDAKVTERYAHLSQRTLQEAANSASLKIQRATVKQP